MTVTLFWKASRIRSWLIQAFTYPIHLCVSTYKSTTNTPLDMTFLTINLWKISYKFRHWLIHLCSTCNYIISKSTWRQNKVIAVRGFAAAKLGKCVEGLSLEMKPEHLMWTAWKFRLHQILFPFNGVPDYINLNHLCEMQGYSYGKWC